MTIDDQEPTSIRMGWRWPWVCAICTAETTAEQGAWFTRHYAEEHVIALCSEKCLMHFHRKLAASKRAG